MLTFNITVSSLNPFELPSEVQVHVKTPGRQWTEVDTCHGNVLRVKDRDVFVVGIFSSI